MTKLKVLLICEQPLPSSSRAGRPNFTVRYLSSRGHDVTVISPRPNEPPDNAATYEYLDIRFEQFSVFTRMRILNAIQRKAERLLKSERFDLARTISIVPTYAAIQSKSQVPIYAELADFLSDLYTQFRMPGQSLVLPLLRRMEREIARKVDCATVETAVGKEYWCDLGLRRDKITVIPGGVDTQHFDPRTSDPSPVLKQYHMEGKDVLFYHGDMGPADGVDLLIRALGKIDRSSLATLIVGTGPDKYMNHLRNLVSENRLNVQFAGWVEYRNLPNYIASCTLAVLPLVPRTRMTRANLHTRVREYLSMEKPFLVTATEGIRSTLGDLPFYIDDPTDLDGLANSIELSLRNCRTIDRRLLRRIAEALDWKNVIAHDEMVMTSLSEGKNFDAKQFDLALNGQSQPDWSLSKRS